MIIMAEYVVLVEVTGVLKSMRINSIFQRQPWRMKEMSASTTPLPASKGPKWHKAPCLAPAATHPGLSCRCPSAAQEGAHGQKK